jgi:predicted O-linked N-acetylglucosamine transferase (SPINDLY family)/SAM-dependent methyltransferase
MTTIAGSGPAADASDFSAADLLRGALEFHAAGHFDMARDLYDKILKIEPENPVAWHHLGLIAHMRGDHTTAAVFVDKAIALQPDYVQAFSNLAAIYRAVGDIAAAAASAERAVALDPNFAAAHSNLGNVREEQGDLENALTAYREACRLDPYFVEAHANAADVLRKLKRHQEALTICDAIVEKRPEAARPYFCAGNILRELLRSSEAVDAFRRAIALQPAFAEAHCNLGNLLLRQGNCEDAIRAYQEAIALKPDVAQTHCNLGAAYEMAQRSTEAIESYSRALALDPDLVGVQVQLYHQRRIACDWDGIEETEAQLLARVATCDDPLPPFAFLSMDSSPALQQRVARNWAAAFVAPRRFAHPRPTKGAAKERLKIGYLSSDFHRHATAHLMAELFERHDRSRFEIIAYSHGADDCSEMRYRLGRAFDAFVDLRNPDDGQAAERIYADGVDILVELKGYTQLARSEIAAHRPAPIQVNYLGYPGTMGCDFIDYVIADPITLPMEQQPFFDEKIVHLPDCYQPNDTKRRVAELTPSRADSGLPEKGFVFCCFNNSYKLSPRFFSIWMRLLKAVPDSVLWLFDANGQVKDNLEREAMARGVDPKRLVFAPRVSPADHLARQRLADLFLDCLPYNAHTTTSDALWVGLPVVTHIGETFAGRVAASLLHAIGMSELVTESDEDYEAIALRLATDAQLLADTRRKLQANKWTMPLFDAERFARHLEGAYEEMWAIWAAGEAPRGFAVTPLAKEPEAAMAPAEVTRIEFAGCPLCGSHGHMLIQITDCSRHPLYRAGLPREIEWQSCRACNHVFTRGYFAPGTLPVLAPPLGDGLEDGRRVAAAIIERIAAYVPQGAWLDVEFGSGSLHFTAAEFGYDAIGLSANADHVAALQRLGFDAQCGSLADVAGTGRFGVISLADILPRQPFPTETLDNARRLLRPDGVLFLSLPNREPVLFNLLNAASANPHWSALDHYHLFGRSRLYRLLRDVGFEPLDYRVSPAHKVGMEVIARRLP